MEGGRRTRCAGWLLLWLTCPAAGQLSSPAQPPTGEAFFRSGSSFITLSDTVRLQAGDLLGFSFRTCHPAGQLLRQIGDIHNSVSLGLTEAGAVRLVLQSGDLNREAEVGTGLADGAWHTVRLGVASTASTVCLSVDRTGQECEPPRTGPSVVGGAESTVGVARLEGVAGLLGSLNLTGGVLRLGSGMVGCLREGPGVRTTSGKVSQSQGVDWENCLLPTQCQGYNWSLLSEVQQSPQLSSLCSSCSNSSACLPPLDTETSVCSCPPGFTGRTCSLPSTSCSQEPCLHGANCTESQDISQGYVCHCDGTGHFGHYCHKELNHCAGHVCANGGLCLDQPGGFLCECSAEYHGALCTRRRDQRTESSRQITDMSGVSDPCLSEPNPCQNGGTCIFTSSGAGSSRTCSCPSTWTGPTCLTPLTPLTTASTPLPSDCSTNPCENGGTCQDTGPGTFTCSCLPSYQGPTCAGPRARPCEAQPCQNEGTCLEQGDSFTCSCGEGFTGPTCQLDIDECLTSPCQHGSCVNLDGGYRCSCSAGWSGQNCDIDRDECLGEPCSNSGTCIDQENGFLCQCVAGYTGLTCEENIDECASQPCKNGGQCMDGVDGYTCTCSNRYMGDNCEEDYDPCATGPCENGAACVRQGDERGSAEPEFYCECVPGYSGPTCGVNTDDCLGVTCPANHTCVDLVMDHECRCPPGLQGEGCTQDIDECQPEPCENGGTCVNLLGEYRCDCPTGWTGTNCSEDVDECEEEDICNKGICRNTNGSYECFCRPGYSGSHCNFEFDECLSNPCQNNGTCDNLVNKYHCSCLPGFNGTECQHNIDECAVSPCFNGATCLDGINNYTCNCPAGYRGRDCEVDIDDCESTPCLHGATCVDGVNEYTCNCTNTGYTGTDCETDINECEVEPCLHNSTCVNQVNDYSCDCWPGFQGKNCSEDISECSQQPCRNNASCYEKSDTSLYQPPEVVAALPADIRPHFTKGFNYNSAAGYLCHCLDGFEGADCQTNINECQSEPCMHGAECVDGIAEYTCHCRPGYRGDQCQVDINECEELQPCENGAECQDEIADYTCHCQTGYGGKNCSVPLVGCEQVTCLNGGTCIPYLLGETDHRGNCTCMPGFAGKKCQIVTTFSFKGDSYVSVASPREEGFELSFRFRTTLPNGTVAIGQGASFFALQLRNGALNLHSSMLSRFEGILLGQNLADTEWQKVYVSLNETRLILGLNDNLQSINQINPDFPAMTAFNSTFLGGASREARVLASTPDQPYRPFIGCIQDISVNGIKVTERDVLGTEGIMQNNTEKGCLRTDQCNPNPCQNEGICTDLWRTYSCKCDRPFVGPSCQYNYTAATFGFENTTDSQAVIDIDNPRDFLTGIDLTMFIRTRKLSGLIFYLGKSDPSSPIKNQIVGRLVNGTLQVEATFGEKPSEFFKLYSAELSNGNRHFIQVIRMKNTMVVKLNNSISINQEFSSSVPIQAERMYLGNLLTVDYSVEDEMPISTTTTTTETTTKLTTVSTTETPTTTTTTTAATATALPPVSPSSPSPPELPTNTDMASLETTADDLSETVTDSQMPAIEDISTAVTSPIISRMRRQGASFVEEQEAGESGFFKGIIQDVRLSNGEDVTKIIHLFEVDFEEKVEILPSLGEVTKHGVKKGIVSDDTCRVNPCQNEGKCKVTWNDYQCFCKPGYAGSDCHEIEYCYWNSCPADSMCRTLSDGHECVTNATFNGVNTSLAYTPRFRDNVTIDQIRDKQKISATFRTKTNGTLFDLVRRGESVTTDQHIRISILNSRVELMIPGLEEIRDGNFIFGEGLDDGAWHTVVIKPTAGVLLVEIDGVSVDEDYLKENSTLNNLQDFVKNSEIILGAGFDINRDDDSNEDLVNFFRGCLSEVRIAGILLPFFTEKELVNSTSLDRFVVDERAENLTRGDCLLCYQDECQNDGECEDPNELFECSCQDGFDGPTCEINIDECLDHACVHGSCVDRVNNYTCSCENGWTGWLCDQDKDECEDLPCQNGGSCEQTEAPGDYMCTCLEEYKGKDCEELKVKTCREQPCTNGGTCIEVEGDSALQDQYRCDCPQGYEGTNCEKQTDFCVKFSADCLNGGTCFSDFSAFDYNCQCMAGYEGKNCETNTDDCAGLPCQNGGECIDQINGFRCNCEDTGYEGTLCENNIDECKVFSPCLNQAICNDTVGDYNCHCRDNFCGKNCQREDPCSDQLQCHNDGVCVASCDSERGFTCNCGEGWSGHNCHLKSSSTEELALIVGPIVGGMAFIALVGLLVFLVMARRKRKGEGHYRPAKQELTSPRLQLDNMLKIPPEERLI